MLFKSIRYNFVAISDPLGYTEMPEMNIIKVILK